MEGQEFCSKCGQKAGLNIEPSVASSINQFNSRIVKKHKNFKTLTIIIAAVLVCAIIGGIFTYHVVSQRKKEAYIALQQKNKKDYLTKASDFDNDVISSGQEMETIGNEIQSAWSDYINNDYTFYSSIDDAVEQAQQSQSSNIDSVKSEKDTISALYADLLKVPNVADESELQEIKSAVKDAYEAYLNMYDCVTNPTGNYSAFSSNFGDADSKVVQKVDILTNLLK